jgi:hypothetical protein
LRFRKLPRRGVFTPRLVLFIAPLQPVAYRDDRMQTIRAILDWVNGAFERPLVGLPLRMIFTCSWHRIHGALVAMGMAMATGGSLLGYREGWWLGVLVAGPSVMCVGLWFLLAPALALLEWVSGYQTYRAEQAAAPDSPRS